MKNSGSQKSGSPSQLIDARIEELGDWRRDAQPAPWLGQGSRSRSRRGVEVERSSGVVARRNHLYRRDVQEWREDDLRAPPTIFSSSLTVGFCP